MVDVDQSTYGFIYFDYLDNPAERIKLKINKLLNLSSITMYGGNDRSFKDVEIYAEDTYCGTCGIRNPCYVRCYYPVKADEIYITNLQLSTRIYEIKFQGEELPRGLTDLAKVGIAVGACCFLALLSLCTVRHFKRRRNRRSAYLNQYKRHFTERYAIDLDGDSRFQKVIFFQDLYTLYRIARLSCERNGHLEVDHIYLKESTKWTIGIKHDTAGRSRSRVEFQVIRIENSLREKTIVRFKEIDEDGPRDFSFRKIYICQEFEWAREASSIEDSRRREEIRVENRRGEEVGQVEEVSRQEINTEEQTLRPSAPQMMDLAPPSYETYHSNNINQTHDDIPSYEEVMTNSKYFPGAQL